MERYIQIIPRGSTSTQTPQRQTTYSRSLTTSKKNQKDKLTKEEEIAQNREDDGENGTDEEDLKSKEKSNHYFMKFKSEWMTETSSNYKIWVKEVKATPYKFRCEPCRKNYYCDYLKLHETNGKHQTNLEKFIKSKQDGEIPSLAFYDELFNNKVKVTLFLIQKNLSFALAPEIAGLMKSCFSDSLLAKHMVVNEKNTKDIVFGIKECVKAEIYDLLKTKPYALLVDESTDVSNKKQLAFIIRYLNESYEYEYALLDMVHIERANSVLLYTKLKEAFHNDGNLMNNLVGLSTDGARNMRGKYNSLTQKVLLSNKNIFTVHCLCHVGNLIAKRAQTALPGQLVKFVKRIYSYFSHSSFHNDEYIAFQKSLKLEPLKIPEPSPTRWTGIFDSICIVLRRWSTLEQYFYTKIQTGNNLSPNFIDEEEAMINLFDEEDFDQNQTNSATKTPIEQVLYEFLKDNEMKAYCELLKCVLTRITSFIKLFEGDNFDLSQAYDVILSFIKYFFSNLILLPYLQSNLEKKYKTFRFENQRTLYMVSSSQFERDFPQRFGDQIAIRDLISAQKKTFFQHTFNYFKRAALAIQDYITLQDLKIFNLLSFKNRKSNDIEQWMAAYKRFQYIMGTSTQEDFYLEVIDFMSMEFKVSDQDSNTDLWKKAKDIKLNDKLRFPLLSRLIETLLVLPFSSAEIERTFSSLNLVKTPARNRLADDTLTSLLTVKQSLKRKRDVFDGITNDDLKKIKKAVSTLSGQDTYVVNLNNPNLSANLQEANPLENNQQ